MRVGDLPPEILHPENNPPDRQARPAAADQDISGLAGAEREALLQQAVIEKVERVGHEPCGYSAVGISRNTLYRKIKRHGIPLVRGSDKQWRLAVSLHPPCTSEE